MTKGVFDLEDEEFWSGPWRTFEDVYDKTTSEEIAGVFFDAPKLVELGQREGIPATMLFSAERRESWSVDPLLDMIAVSSRLEDRAVFASRIVVLGDEDDTEEDEPERNTGPCPEPQDRFTHSIQLLDLASGPGLAETGTYQTRLILRERVSEPVQTRLQPPAPAYEDEAVKAFLEAQRTPPPAPWPPFPRLQAGYPNAASEEGSPAAPEALGIEALSERVVVSKEGARALVRGSFRLLAFPHDVPPPPPEPAEPEEGEEPVEPPPHPSALIPISLVVTGTEAPTPRVLNMKVPVYDQPVDPKAKEGTSVTGHFNVDLFELPETREEGQTLFLYLLSGEVFTGPIKTAIVTEDMLPKPGQ